ncbi:Abi-alpha family protein [Pseudomonas sp. PGPR40]|uniref:Abi-alpha family protein n=1 Tax=Pseudomonas sp. PGPR40 TaxID=2913476 RepID=UPI001EDC4433|nr:Abi-alpha family protein [Pseudomonas sp. PGPR40]
MTEESKAVEEVAKTTGQAIEAAREAGGFIAKYIAGPLEQGIGIFEDRLKYMRWERQVRYMLKSQEFLRLAGLSAPTRAVPLKLAIPLMQGATLEEDDFLQDRWAALLVNAANADFRGEVRRSHTVILEQLTHLDAQILDALFALPFEQCQHDGIITAQLPTYARVTGEREQEFPLPSEEVVLSLSNLTRLGCIRPMMTWGGGESYGRVNPTIAGKAFVEACSAPTPPRR